MPNPYVRELLLGSDQQANQAADAKNMETRDQSARVLSGIATAMLSPQDDVTSASGNRILLLAGQYPGCNLNIPDLWLSGCPGAQMTGALNLGSSGRITGIDFITQNTGPLVQITATCNPIIFYNCTFTKSQGIGGDYVTIQAGAKVVFIGCIFYGTQTAGWCVNNLGIMADCQIVGGANLTGSLHQNSTVTGQIT